MEEVEYFEPKSVAEACALLAERENAKLLAGGASLGALLKSKLIFPEALVTLKSVPGLREIERTPGGELRIGALCRHREIVESPLLREHCSVLAEAGAKIASPAIRNVGTIGGNICHGDPTADFPPALIALGAQLEVVGSGGTRVVPVREFFTDHYETVLSPDEIVVSIRIPPLPPRCGAASLDLTKTHNSVAIVHVAALVGVDERGRCTHAGLGAGGVASTPLHISEAATLVGEPLSPAGIERVAEAAMEQARPVSNSHASASYRREMVGVLTRRALRAAWERAGKAPADISATRGREEP
ncbi:MAG: xanthine dehydrogenase family protein subunit M [Deltaproteobacteria bacterium]|nr:xanthine dehydrogenase family protein subunit M [Deltaproteobacteria bacterium]